MLSLFGRLAIRHLALFKFTIKRGNKTEEKKYQAPDPQDIQLVPRVQLEVKHRERLHHLHRSLPSFNSVVSCGQLFAFCRLRLCSSQCMYLGVIVGISVADEGDAENITKFFFRTMAISTVRTCVFCSKYVQSRFNRCRAPLDSLWWDAFGFWRNRVLFMR